MHESYVRMDSLGDMLEESYAVLPDFSSYFSFSRTKTGYSGVATYCKRDFRPEKAEEGLGGTLPSSKDSDCLGHHENLLEEFSIEDLKALDKEGRCVMTQHNTKAGETFTGSLYHETHKTFPFRKDPKLR